MHAMVEAGAIPALLRHLLTDSLPRPSKPTAGEAGSGHHGAGDVDQMAEQHPSVLLAARLLHAFSLEPHVRCAIYIFACFVFCQCFHLGLEATAEVGG